MKHLLLNLTPDVVLDSYRTIRRRLRRPGPAMEAPQQVFSEIYANNKWGGEEGSFFSGDGTRDEAIYGPYVETLSRLAEERDFSSLTGVDLGCGDMTVGARLAPLFGSYVGVDVVPEMIESHRQQFADKATVDFRHLDIVADELPDGDVCMIRQVLQHLSNAQIQQILAKLDKYSLVIFTEHLPVPNPRIHKNLDIPRVGGVRLVDNSGVYLTEAPFSLPESRTEVILEVEGYGGVIQTMLYEPPNASA